jgi:hypothetical protein
MWYHPAAFFVGKRDVIGAWVMFASLLQRRYPVVMTALNVWAEDLHTAGPLVAVPDADQRIAGRLCCDRLE